MTVTSFDTNTRGHAEGGVTSVRLFGHRGAGRFMLDVTGPSARSTWRLRRPLSACRHSTIHSQDCGHKGTYVES